MFNFKKIVDTDVFPYVFRFLNFNGNLIIVEDFGIFLKFTYFIFRLQGVANSIAWMARNLSFDGCYMSPFAKSARQNGIDAIGLYLSFVNKFSSDVNEPGNAV